MRDHLNESYWTILLCGAVQGGVLQYKVVCSCSGSSLFICHTKIEKSVNETLACEHLNESYWAVPVVASGADILWARHALLERLRDEPKEPLRRRLYLWHYWVFNILRFSAQFFGSERVDFRSPRYQSEKALHLTSWISFHLQAPEDCPNFGFPARRRTGTLVIPQLTELGGHQLVGFQGTEDILDNIKYSWTSLQRPPWRGINWPL